MHRSALNSPPENDFGLRDPNLESPKTFSGTLKNHLLESVPDWVDWEMISCWLEKRKQLESLDLESLTPQNWISLSWNDLDTAPPSHFGHYASPLWRKFVLATFFADLCSYPSPLDQVSFDRLLFVMHRFPQGFTTWWYRLADSCFLPVGYTGWYPMLEAMFQVFEKSPQSCTDRTVVPCPHSPWLYLFNYSVAAPFRRTPYSSQLVKHYAQEISKQKFQGLACINVSDEGTQVARKFGMNYSGSFQTTHPNDPSQVNIEHIYILKNTRL